MTVAVRKAGEAAAKAAKTVLRPPRAVTAAEAQSIQPARSSNQTTMMPWKGWFQRFLQERVFSEDQYKRFRETFFFMPNDIYDLEQAPKPAQKIPISKTDPTITHQYRHPSPGSQGHAVIPEFDETDDPYDTNYFKRDTKRRYESSEMLNKENEMMKLKLMDQTDPDVQEEIKAVEAGPASSPGNSGRFATGPSDFDPTGLRATMSVTWDKLEESLDSYMPDHLPTPTWVGKEEEIIKWHEDRDLPVPVGGYYEALKVPVERRVARW